MNDSSLKQTETKERHEIENEGNVIVDYILTMAGIGCEEQTKEIAGGRTVSFKRSIKK